MPGEAEPWSAGPAGRIRLLQAAEHVPGHPFLPVGSLHGVPPGVPAGLTTAPTLWVVAAIGMRVGGGNHLAAVVGTVLVLLVLLALGRLEGSVARMRMCRTVCITVEGGEGIVERIQSFAEVAGLRVELEGMHRDPATDHVRLTMEIRGKESVFRKACSHLLPGRAELSLVQVGMTPAVAWMVGSIRPSTTAWNDSPSRAGSSIADSILHSIRP